MANIADSYSGTAPPLHLTTFLPNPPPPTVPSTMKLASKKK